MNKERVGANLCVRPNVLLLRQTRRSAPTIDPQGQTYVFAKINLKIITRTLFRGPEGTRLAQLF